MIGTVTIFKLWRSTITICLFAVVPLQLYIAHTNATEYASDRIGPSSRRMRRLRIFVWTPGPSSRVDKVHDDLAPTVFPLASLPLLPPLSIGFEHARLGCSGAHPPLPTPSLSPTPSPPPPQPWPWPPRLQALYNRGGLSL